MSALAPLFWFNGLSAVVDNATNGGILIPKSSFA
jgi:predicted cation transporter